MNEDETAEREEHPALEELRRVCDEILNSFGYDPDRPFG
jgi:hypothetical protein